MSQFVASAEDYRLGGVGLLLATFAVLCAFARRILIAKAQRTAKNAKEQATLPNLEPSPQSDRP